MEAYNNEPEFTKTELLNTPPEDAEPNTATPEESAEALTPTVDELTEKGISAEMAAALVNKDYEALKKAIDDTISAEIEKRITPNIPKTKQVENRSGQLKAFASMGYKDRLELSKKNPRLYRELSTKLLQGEC